MAGISRWRIFASIVVIALVAGGVLLCRILSFHCENPRNGIADKGFLPVASVIVPHHLLAQGDIEKTFQSVSEKVGSAESVRRIILLSPNHFNVGRSWIVGSSEEWQTPYGTLEPDKDMVASLASDSHVMFGDGILEREHGIRNLLPFIKQYFPEASVTPLAVRDGIPDHIADVLAKEIISASDARTIVIVSADFSHYLDWNFSRFHDQQSIQALKEVDFQRIKSLDADCVGCLRIALRYAERRWCGGFDLIARSSALESIGKNLVGEETTHIAGYFFHSPDDTADVSRTVRLLFSGPLGATSMSLQARRMFMGQDGGVSIDGGDAFLSVYDPDSDTMQTLSDRLLTMNNERYRVTERFIAGRAVVFIGATSEMDDTVERTIREADAAGKTVLVYWLESVDPSVWNKNNHIFAESGAVAIFGQQNAGNTALEMYGDTPAFPSLIFQSDCHDGGEDCDRFMVGASFSEYGAEYLLMPISPAVDGKFGLATGVRRERILEAVAAGQIDDALKKEISKGVFSVGHPEKTPF